MSDTVDAIVTRPRGINGRYACGELIRDMPANQFADWRSMGWVARATPRELEAHEAKKRAPARRNKARKAA